MFFDAVGHVLRDRDLDFLGRIAAASPRLVGDRQRLVEIRFQPLEVLLVVPAHLYPL